MKTIADIIDELTANELDIANGSVIRLTECCPEIRFAYVSHVIECVEQCLDLLTESGRVAADSLLAKLRRHAD